MDIIEPILTEEEKKEKLIQKIIELEAVKKELQARKYTTDLFEFNRKILKVEDGGNAVPLSAFHRELCDYIMLPDDKKLVLVPRGHLKSTLITVGYSLLRVAQNPEVRGLIANATYDMACSFLSQIKKHIQYNEVFKDYYGDMSTGAEKWSENMITIPKRKAFAKKEATLTAYGMGGNLVSQHYDFIIGDDLVNRDYVTSTEMIEKTVLFYKDALDLLEPGGVFIIIGTRWHDADLYGWIMDKKNPEQVYKSFSSFIRKAYTGNLETGENLDVLFPEKYNADILRGLKINKGPYEFSTQYLNDPIPTEKAKFKTDWFKLCLEDELKVRELNLFTMVDPAIGQRKDSDKTAIVTIAVDQWNNWFVVNIIWDHMLPNDIINYIFSNWEQYHPKKIGVEMVSYQKSLQYALVDEMRRRNIFLPIVELKAEKSKAERIEGLIPRYANGAIYHLEQCPFRSDMEDQLMRYPVAKHDDIIDALAYGLQISVQARKPSVRRWGSNRDSEDRRRSTFLY